MSIRPFFAALITLAFTSAAFAVDLRIATFNIDATPPKDSALCSGSVPPVRGVNDPLSARGLILLPAGQKPVVLVSLDWVGIGNEGHSEFRAAFAEAVRTSIDRVAVHTIHQHDAPSCDFTVEKLLAANGLSGEAFNPEFARAMIQRCAEAARNALDHAVSISHIGLGKAMVEKVASNRRVLGSDGMVEHVRWSATTDPEARAAPEGVIDPWVRAVSFWDEGTPVVIVTYYATHPQSYYRTGLVSADFPGWARSMREEDLPRAIHIHFNGAAGNVTAGKYNDGAPANREVLAERLHDGMKRAFEATERFPVVDADFAWNSVDVHMPLRPEIDFEEQKALVASKKLSTGERLNAAHEVAWMQQVIAGVPTTLSRLRIGSLQIVHMPAELFIEYQLAAQAMAPDDFVCMAAYGDYGAGYIGTAISYTQGGYETQLRTSRTAPEVEPILMDALKELVAP